MIAHGSGVDDLVVTVASVALVLIVLAIGRSARRREESSREATPSEPPAAGDAAEH